MKIAITLTRTVDEVTGTEETINVMVEFHERIHDIEDVVVDAYSTTGDEAIEHPIIRRAAIQAAQKIYGRARRCKSLHDDGQFDPDLVKVGRRIVAEIAS